MKIDLGFLISFSNSLTLENCLVKLSDEGSNFFDITSSNSSICCCRSSNYAIC